MSFVYFNASKIKPHEQNSLEFYFYNEKEAAKEGFGHAASVSIFIL